jgi:hypothetical protein
MAAATRPGERATSFATACSLLSRLVRQNGAAAAELGLGIKGEAPSPPAVQSRVVGPLISLSLVWFLGRLRNCCSHFDSGDEGISGLTWFRVRSGPGSGSWCLWGCACA